MQGKDMANAPYRTFDAVTTGFDSNLNNKHESHASPK